MKNSNPTLSLGESFQDVKSNSPPLSTQSVSERGAKKPLLYGLKFGATFTSQNPNQEKLLITLLPTITWLIWWTMILPRVIVFGIYLTTPLTGVNLITYLDR